MPENTVPRAWHKPSTKHGEPPHPFFAVLEAAWRNPNFKNMRFDEPGRYVTLHPDDPRANEFRAYCHGVHGMRSMPVGSDREIAEMIVFALNESFAAGMQYAKREERGGWPIKVGRRGHRDETAWAQSLGFAPLQMPDGASENGNG